MSSYDSAGIESMVQLTTGITKTFADSVRTSFLANISGAYLLGVTTAVFDTATSNNATTQLSAPTTVSQYTLKAGTAPVALLVRAPANQYGPMELRRSTNAATTTFTSLAFGDSAGQAILDTTAGAGYYVIIFKRPIDTATLDRALALWVNGPQIYLNSGTAYIGSSKTAFTTSNAYNRLWQVIAADATLWPHTLFCGVSDTNSTSSDVIRAGLVTAGASAADLAAYDAAGLNEPVVLTTAITKAFTDALRTAWAAGVSGSYLLGSTTTQYDTATTNITNTGLAMPNTTTTSQFTLTANTAPFALFARLGASNQEGTLELRRATNGVPASNTLAAVSALTFGSAGVKPSYVSTAAGVGYYVIVYKRPTNTSASNGALALGYQGVSIALSSVAANWVDGGMSRTTLSTSNTFNRHWQAMAASPTLWPSTLA